MHLLSLEQQLVAYSHLLYVAEPRHTQLMCVPIHFCLARVMRLLLPEQQLLLLLFQIKMVFDVIKDFIKNISSYEKIFSLDKK